MQLEASRRGMEVWELQEELDKKDKGNSSGSDNEEPVIKNNQRANKNAPKQVEEEKQQND